MRSRTDPVRRLEYKVEDEEKEEPRWKGRYRGGWRTVAMVIQTNKRIKGGLFLKSCHD